MDKKLIEAVKYNFANNIYVSKEIVTILLKKTDDEINELYTKEKEKYSGLVKLVRLKNGGYGLQFADGELSTFPYGKDASIRILKEIYIAISKSGENFIITEEV